MSITNPFPPFILHTKFNSLLLCFAPVRANSMRSLSVWEFFFLSLSPSRMLILHFFPFICAVFSAIPVLFVGLYNLNILLVETSAFECCRTVIRIMQNAFEPLQKTISMISFCSVRRELKHDSFEPFFLHILPLTEIYFRDCGNFEFQTHICTVEKKVRLNTNKSD